MSEVSTGGVKEKMREKSIKYLSKAVVLFHAFCVVEKLSIKPWKAWKFLSFGVVELVTMKASG